MKATNYFKVSAQGMPCALFPCSNETDEAFARGQADAALARVAHADARLSVFRFTPAFPEVPVIGVGGGFTP